MPENQKFCHIFSVFVVARLLIRDAITFVLIHKHMHWKFFLYFNKNIILFKFDFSQSEKSSYIQDLVWDYLGQDTSVLHNNRQTHEEVEKTLVWRGRSNTEKGSIKKQREVIFFARLGRVLDSSLVTIWYIIPGWK